MMTKTRMSWLSTYNTVTPLCNTIDYANQLIETEIHVNEDEKLCKYKVVLSSNIHDGHE